MQKNKCLHLVLKNEKEYLILERQRLQWPVVYHSWFAVPTFILSLICQIPHFSLLSPGTDAVITYLYYHTLFYSYKIIRCMSGSLLYYSVYLLDHCYDNL